MNLFGRTSTGKTNMRHWPPSSTIKATLQEMYDSATQVHVYLTICAWTWLVILDGTTECQISEPYISGTWSQNIKQLTSGTILTHCWTIICKFRWHVSDTTKKLLFNTLFQVQMGIQNTVYKVMNENRQRYKNWLHSYLLWMIIFYQMFYIL